jgi:hypothetical protein
MRTLNFGQLPDLNQFRDSFHSFCPDGIYRVRNSLVIENGDYTVDTLWDLLVKLIDVWDNDPIQEVSEQAGNLASSILETLGFEWV